MGHVASVRKHRTIHLQPAQLELRPAVLPRAARPRRSGVRALYSFLQLYNMLVVAWYSCTAPPDVSSCTQYSSIMRHGITLNAPLRSHLPPPPQPPPPPPRTSISTVTGLSLRSLRSHDSYAGARAPRLAAVPQRYH